MQYIHQVHPTGARETRRYRKKLIGRYYVKGKETGKITGYYARSIQMVAPLRSSLEKFKSWFWAFMPNGFS